MNKAELVNEVHRLQGEGTSRAAAERAAPAKARPSPSLATRPIAVPDPECDPPYALDDQGHKIWKEECFRKRSP